MSGGILDSDLTICPMAARTDADSETKREAKDLSEKRNMLEKMIYKIELKVLDTSMA